MTIVQIRDYAFKCHADTNHLYDGKPYGEAHLQSVFDVGSEYIYLISNVRDRTNVLGACYCHDLIEDTRQTYNDVKNNTNVMIADIAYACTNEKGRNRKERANDKYYEGIRITKYAPFVKLCDRIANVQYSKSVGSQMHKMYKKENEDFLDYILYRDQLDNWNLPTYQPNLEPLVDKLKSLF